MFLIKSRDNLNFQHPDTKETFSVPHGGVVVSAPVWIKKSGMWDIGASGSNPSITVLTDNNEVDSVYVPTGEKPKKVRASKTAAKYDELTKED
jgi:hypothetical protein